MSEWRVRLTIIAYLSISLGPAATVHAVDFGKPTTYPVGVNPAAAVVADFNGDEKLDIAVANAGSGSVSILLGNGDGTFQQATNFDAGMLNPSGIAVGDFNHDGRLDIATFQPGNPATATSSAASILLGNSDGTFQTAKPVSLSHSSVHFAVADFNGDQKSDLVVSEVDLST